MRDLLTEPKFQGLAVSENADLLTGRRMLRRGMTESAPCLPLPRHTILISDTGLKTRLNGSPPKRTLQCFSLKTGSQ